MPRRRPPAASTAPAATIDDRRRPLRDGAVAGLIACVALVATEPLLAIGWDEGYTLGREARVRSWLSALVDPAGFAVGWQPPAIELVQRERPPAPSRAPVLPPRPEQIDTRSELFDPGVIAYYWPFAREEPHGHPPFYAILGLAGDLLTPWRADLGRARLGPILLYSIAVGVLFTFLERRRGRWAAIGGTAALLLQPRLFGHAHYAAYDGPLTALWVLGVLGFAKATEDARDRGRRNPYWASVIGFGAILGCAMATKLTGWLLPLPFLAWSALYRERRGALTLLAAAPVALLVAYALVPPWWHDPMGGLARFFASNTSRGATIQIDVMYLGKVYRTPIDSLPWHNTVVLTAAVVPLGFLVLGLVGAIGAVFRVGRERFGVLVAGHWLFLLLLRSLPHVPGHDGVRLFLPAFGMLAMAAGIGAGWVADRFGRWGGWLVILAVAEGAISVLVMLPVPLAYYGPLVLGPPGAERLGLEPTYYWDALAGPPIDWLNENTPEGGKILTATFPTSFLYLNRSGTLKPTIDSPFAPPGRPSWYVMQNRPGAMPLVERNLLAREKPAFVFGKLGVPLLWIFPFEEFEAAYRDELRRQNRSPGGVLP